jgi:hypothetical protein
MDLCILIQVRYVIGAAKLTEIKLADFLNLLIEQIMTKKLNKNKSSKVLLAALFSIAGISISTSASAIGLGEMRAISSLGQPFVAEVQIFASNPKEVDAIGLRASPILDYEEMGVEYPSVADKIKLTMLQRNGAYFAQLKSSVTVSDLALNIILEGVTPNGKIKRNYVLLFSPEAGKNVFSPSLSDRAAGVAKKGSKTNVDKITRKIARKENINVELTQGLADQSIEDASNSIIPPIGLMARSIQESSPISPLELTKGTMVTIENEPAKDVSSLLIVPELVLAKEAVVSVTDAVTLSTVLAVLEIPSVVPMQLVLQGTSDQPAILIEEASSGEVARPGVSTLQSPENLGRDVIQTPTTTTTVSDTEKVILLTRLEEESVTPIVNETIQKSADLDVVIQPELATQEKNVGAIVPDSASLPSDVVGVDLSKSSSQQQGVVSEEKVIITVSNEVEKIIVKEGGLHQIHSGKNSHHSVDSSQFSNLTQVGHTPKRIQKVTGYGVNQEAMKALRAVTPHDWSGFATDDGVKKAKNVSWSSKNRSWLLSLNSILAQSGLFAIINWDTKQIDFSSVYAESKSVETLVSGQVNPTQDGVVQSNVALVAPSIDPSVLTEVATPLIEISEPIAPNEVDLVVTSVPVVVNLPEPLPTLDGLSKENLVVASLSSEEEVVVVPVEAITDVVAAEAPVEVPPAAMDLVQEKVDLPTDSSPVIDVNLLQDPSISSDAPVAESGKVAILPVATSAVEVIFPLEVKITVPEPVKFSSIKMKGVNTTGDTVVRGGGYNIGLLKAISAISPKGWFIYSKNSSIPVDRLAEWKGGNRNWMIVLDELLSKNKLVATIDNDSKEINISNDFK